jgi:hypothetical protein
VSPSTNEWLGLGEGETDTEGVADTDGETDRDGVALQAVQPYYCSTVQNACPWDVS